VPPIVTVVQRVPDIAVEPVITVVAVRVGVFTKNDANATVGVVPSAACIEAKPAGSVIGSVRLKVNAPAPSLVVLPSGVATLAESVIVNATVVLADIDPVTVIGTPTGPFVGVSVAVFVVELVKTKAPEPLCERGAMRARDAAA
jgi:hypothetical protein